MEEIKLIAQALEKANKEGVYGMEESTNIYMALRNVAQKVQESGQSKQTQEKPIKEKSKK